MDRTAHSTRLVARYGTLDALRGIAAFVIIIYHFGSFELLPRVAQHGYLAVDFFFILSGFVISAAYSSKLGPDGSNMAVGGRHIRRIGLFEFFQARLIRLYPLAALGVVLGFVGLILKWAVFPASTGPIGNVIASLGFNIFLLPYIFGNQFLSQSLFPGNGALWSLFCELYVNLIWGALAAKLRTRAMNIISIYIVLFVVPFLTWSIMENGAADMGFNVPTVMIGILRVTSGFLIGVLIFGFRIRNLNKWRVNNWVVMVGLVACLLMPTELLGQKYLPAMWDCLCIYLLFPLIVFFGSARQTSSRLDDILGVASYPSYAMHYPILAFVAGLHRTILVGVNSGLVVIATCGLVAITVYVATKFYDQPVRRYLENVFRRPGSRSVDLFGPRTSSGR